MKVNRVFLFEIGNLEICLVRGFSFLFWGLVIGSGEIWVRCFVRFLNR